MVGGERLYAIHSAGRFTELQRVGSRWLKYEVEAKMYPELVRVREMLNCNTPYVACPAEEWLGVEVLVGQL